MILPNPDSDSFCHTMDEVRKYVEWICGSDGCDEAVIHDIACKLFQIRPKTHSFTCLRPYGNGVFTWIKSRLDEAGALPPHDGQYAVPDDFVTATLHFVTWDEEKYGPTFEDVGSITKRLQAARSAVNKLVNSKPINQTAAKVSNQYRLSCPYCKELFVNSKAMKLHIKERHPVHNIILGLGG